MTSHTDALGAITLVFINYNTFYSQLKPSTAPTWLRLIRKAMFPHSVVRAASGINFRHFIMKHSRSQCHINDKTK